MERKPRREDYPSNAAFKEARDGWFHKFNKRKALARGEALQQEEKKQKSITPIFGRLPLNV